MRAPRTSYGHRRFVVPIVAAAGLALVVVAGVSPAGAQSTNGASALIMPRSAQAFTNYTSSNGLGSSTVLGVYAIDDTVYVPTLGGLSISTVGGTTFTNYTTGNGLGDNVVIGVFVADDTIYAPTFGGGLSMSGDGGTTFTTRTVTNSGLGSDYMRWVYAIDDAIYAATNGGLSISIDGGQTFTNYTTANGLGSNTVRAVAVVDDTVYAATDGGLSISTIGGTTFTTRNAANSGLGNDVVTGVFVVDDAIYAATYGGGLSVSTDGGTTFTSRTVTNSGLGSDHMFGVYAVDDTVYAATDTGLSISVNGGTTFTNYTTADGLGSDTVRGVYAFGSRVYAATDGGLGVSAVSGLPPVLTGASPPTTGTVGTAYPGYAFTASGTSPITFTVASGTLPTGLALTTGGVLSGTPTTVGDYTFTVKASNGINPDAVSSSITITVADASEAPPPPPVMPPGEPEAVRAVAGDASATVSWSAPATPGSFPITHYQVHASPAGSCLVSVPALSCEVGGLIDETAYTFRVRALTGAGWGPWSAPSNEVTPGAPVTPPSIIITGSRDGREARVAGKIKGAADSSVTAWVRLPGRSAYVPEGHSPVSSAGTFIWQRLTSKRIYVYFRAASGLRSDRIVIPAP